MKRYTPQYVDAGMKNNVPTIFVIFGATGDLSERKLLPALFDLYQKQMLPQRFRVVGFSRRDLRKEEFAAFVEGAIARRGHGHHKKLGAPFLSHVSYVSGTFQDAGAYERLAEHLIAIDDEIGQCTNKLFHLAVPPEFYEIIFRNLADSGLTIPCSNEEGWTRVLVEKPFGKNLESAQKLDALLGLLFKEEQIFRIDHYLAKETLQNILLFRFSNELFEPLWDNTHIEKVEITLWEKLGTKGRGAFYDGVGALRDVGQNHILQMLSLIAMEHPGALDAAAIRRSRAKVLGALKLSSESAVRAQYRGYRKEKDVAPDSVTETYFKIKANVENDRWRGVPYVLESGKKMKEAKTEISIYFKKTAACLCPPEEEKHHQNVLTFRIQPNEGISVVFWAKRPGFDFALDAKELSFSYKDSPDAQKLPDAYERVLYDCIRGDQTLFTSTEEVKAAWKFITPILEAWKENKSPLQEYKPGQLISTNLN